MSTGQLTVLETPPFTNSSCWKQGLTVSVSGVTESAFISLLTVAILVANVTVIITINSERYIKFIHPQPRYLVMSLACNDLAIGLLVTPLAAISALFQCWPYTEIMCQVQALLRVALPQQNAIILVFMAVDRYTCMLHPDIYHKYSNKKIYVLVLSLTLVTSLVVFGALVIRSREYFYNGNGLMACEPFYQRPSLRILAACLFYFPTTMALMYFYGSALHMDRLRHRQRVNICAALVQPMMPNNTVAMTTLDDASDRLEPQELRQSIRTTRALGAIALGFIVVVTPWTIQEVVMACTGTKMPSSVDFVITWIALSNSFWNPFIYWSLNRKFRRISRNMIKNIVFCRKKYGGGSGAIPPPPPSSSSSSSVAAAAAARNTAHREGCCANRDTCFAALQRDSGNGDENAIEVDESGSNHEDRGGFPPTPPPPPPYHYRGPGTAGLQQNQQQHCRPRRY